MEVAIAVLAAVVIAQPILFGFVVRALHRNHVAQVEDWRTERTELLNRVAHPTMVVPATAAETPDEWVPPNSDYERVGTIDLHAVEDLGVDGDEAG